MKFKIKQHFHKFLSIICAFLIALLSILNLMPVVALSASIGAIMSAAEFALTVSDVYETFILPIISSGHADHELEKAEYMCAWMDFIKDSSLSEEDFRSYWEEIVVNSESYAIGSDEWNAYLMISDSVAYGLTLDSICLVAYHGSGLSDYTISDQGDPQLTSSVIKDIYSDYASRYMPMPTVDTYRWSYQDCKGEKFTTPDYYGFFDFYPLPPIYTYTQGQWGDKGWSSVYMLCYLYDDDVGEYFSKQYIHIYPSTSDDGSPLFHLDYYKLADNTLTYSYTVPWRTDRLFYACDNCSSVSTYSNVMDYLGNTDPQYLYSLSSSSPYIEFAQLYTGSVYSISQYVYSTSFDPVNNSADDCGFILSSKPFELVLNQTSIDFSQVPDNYVITISGDTIYDYSITNPDTGDTSTINYYITNNYTLPENSTDYPGDNGGSSSGGSTSGNVNVSGEVVVGGQIDIKSDPIDINVNVNMGSSEGDNSSAGSSEGVQFDEDVSLNNYYDWMNEQTSGFSGFMKEFFNWLPADILIMICAGFGLVILARFLGR